VIKAVIAFTQKANGRCSLVKLARNSLPNTLGPGANTQADLSTLVHSSADDSAMAGNVIKKAAIRKSQVERPMDIVHGI
jgi:hypothetical protein